MVKLIGITSGLLVASALLAGAAQTAIGQEPGSLPRQDRSPVRAESHQLKTFSSMGKERKILEAGKEAELFRRDGRGCLTHMWLAFDSRTRIRVYIDGEPTPSIDMDYWLGHGGGNLGGKEPWGVAQIGQTGGVYNNYRIPFGKGVRVTVQPISSKLDSPMGSSAWWIIRGTESLPIVIGGVRLPDAARLKLYRVESHKAKPLEEVALCDVRGSGALYQVVMACRGLRQSGLWDDSYEEGCMRAYLDGAKQPEFLSSGLEDYFLGAGYFHQGKLYHTPVAGLTQLDKGKHSFVAYRFHDEDPVFFEKGLRLTCRCGEELDGKVLHDPPETEYTTYTWVYQW